MIKVEKEFSYLYLRSITLFREMGLKQNKDENKSTTISSALTGLRQNPGLASLLIVILALIALSTVLHLLDFKIPAAIAILIIIPFIIAIPVNFHRWYKDQQYKIAEMQELIETKEKYLSDFSHRIRTPLNNFSFIIDYLIDQKPEGNQKEMLETLIASTTNMIEAVNDLTMKTAQVISYEARKDIRFNLDRALLSTIELFEANSAGVITFSLLVPGDLKRDYIGDPITIKQIFLDLFNLIQTGTEGQVNVSVIVEKAGKSKDYSEISFSIEADRGISSFDNIVMSDGRINSMAAKLIDGLKGSYSAASFENQSVFRFVIPLRLIKEEVSESKAAERIKALNTESRGTKKLTDANILLVEDNPTNQKIVLITLRSLVRNIDTATTGKEALDKFGTSNYDVILMDIQLPIMDGITVARKIREIEKSTSRHTPIIAITANAMIGDKEKCLSAGMDEYLSKPFQPARLIDIIETFVTSQNR